MLEDDVLLRDRLLLPGLVDHGFEAAGCGKAAELYRLMLTNRFDIALLDIGVPDEDGLTVTRHLRAMSSIGIVILSASQQRDDRIHAMTEGADMFFSKPVDIEVLAASLHSLMRRIRAEAQCGKVLPPSLSSNRVSSSWCLETDGWCLLSPCGVVIALSVPERCVMRRLIAAQGAPVRRECLIAELSSDVYDFDPHRLEMLIYRLRRKVAEQSRETFPLLTARGMGYVFARGAVEARATG